MEELITTVKLPSHGIFYPENPEYAGDIQLDMMGFEEEKIAFGAASDEALDEVINRCVKNIKDFDCSLLTPQDRRFLLMKLRIHTYGDQYHVTVDEYRDTQEVEETISLDDIKITELPEDFEIPHGKLPRQGDDVQVKVLTVADRRTIDEYCEDKAEKLKIPFSQVRYETLRAKQIDTVNGEELTTKEALGYLHKLKGIDLAYLAHLNSKLDYGFGNTVHIKCQDGEERDVFVQMTGEFFRPRFDD